MSDTHYWQDSKNVREQEAEADIVIEVDRRVPVAIRGATIHLIVDPRPAAHSIGQPRSF